MQQNSILQGYAEGDMRQLAWRLMFSFDKTYNASTTIFKVGNAGSQIGGTDIIPGTNSVVQEWDKYQYVDYSDRVVSIDGFTRETEQVSSVASCYGDIVLNNYDDLFTPGANGPLEPYLLPARPFRLYLGFGDQLIPFCVGLTQGTPIIDETTKTARFHCTDFFQSVWETSLDTLTLSTNVRTDEAVSAVLVNAGLLSSQLVLDRGFNTLQYFAVEKGSKVIDVLKKLMEAEQGRLYMDEQGVINFKNRQNYSSTPVMAFESSRNIISATRTREDSIVNVVEIQSDLRTLQANTLIFDSSFSQLILAGSTLDVWGVLSNPVSSVDTPVYIDSATTSLFSVNSSSDGTGTADSTHVTCTSHSLYGQSYLMTFTNSGTSNLYITAIRLYGTPYAVTDTLHIREQDTASVGKYDERVLSMQNDFFQDQSSATSKAKQILDDYSAFAAVQELEVKGTPALQLDDPITINIFGRYQIARITRIQVSVSVNRFSQNLRLKSFTPRIYFRVGDGGSQIAGSDYVSF